MKYSYRNSGGGFTLIELLLVIAILGILSSVSLATFFNSISKGRDSERKNAVSVLSKAIETYKSDFGTYPDDGDNGEILGCMASEDGEFVACPTADSRFKYFKNGEEVVALSKYPVDPVTGRSFRYEYIPASYEVGPEILTQESFALYAALENLSDKDAKKNIDGTIDPAGWGVLCGTVNCNYKVTDSGLIIK